MNKIIDLQIPSDIIEIKELFSKNDYSLYIVGGSLRDYLINNQPKDWDLATQAHPQQIIDVFKNKEGYKTYEVGRKFGVINIITPHNNQYEIATFREESSYSDNRRPDEVVFSNIENDVKRRDLTINALYYDIHKGEIVDLVGGLEDINNKIIKTVGDPNKRFEEDGLRILRTVRFACAFNYEIEVFTKEAMRKNINNLSYISNERIREEFLKALNKTKSYSRLYSYLYELDIIKWIFPALNVEPFEEGYYDPYVIIANSLRKNQRGIVDGILNEMTFTRKEINIIKFLIHFIHLNENNFYQIKKEANKTYVNNKQIIDISFLNEIGKEYSIPFINFYFSIKGEDIIKEGFEGSNIGKEIRKRENEKFKEEVKKYIYQE